MSQIIKGVSTGSLPPSVPLQFTTDDGIAVPAANNLNVFGGDGAETTGSGSTITVNVVDEGMEWFERNLDFNANIQSGYFCNAALTATLPSAKPNLSPLTIGNILIIYVDTEDEVVIQASPGQSIQVGDTVSAVGGTATCTAGQKGSILELVFKASDQTWHTQSSIGSWITA